MIHKMLNKYRLKHYLISKIDGMLSAWLYLFKDLKLKILYTNDTSKLLYSNNIYPFELPTSVSTILDLCITCLIEGGQFGKFNGLVSAVKIISGIDYNGVNGNSFFDEMTLMKKSPILSTSFVMSSYIPNSEYDIGQGFTCNTNYAFFEGICINYIYCSSLILEIDAFQSFEIGKFYDSSTKKCMFCGSNCSVCSSNSNCLQCRPSYKLISGKCIKCDNVNKCTTTCTGSQIFDPMNQICVDSFSTSSSTLSNPLLSSRIMNDNNEITISPSLSISDQIVHCYIDVDNNPMTLYSFLGGQKFTSSTKLTKSWTQVPKGYQKYVSFQVLFYGSATPSSLQVKINSNAATLESTYKTIMLNKISCSGSGSLTQSIFQVRFSIMDYQTFYNLEILSTSSKWGIRDLNIEVMKCHPTCENCFVGGKESDCSSCGSNLQVNKFSCICSNGYYVKYKNCFESQCSICQKCSVNKCLVCEDITGKCTQCQSGYTIKDGQCIANTLCITNDSIYYNFCGVSKEDAFIHFKNDRILQYGDYWQFYNNKIFAMTCVKTRRCLPLITQQHMHTLTMTLPQFYTYHFQIYATMEMYGYNRIDGNDYVKIYENNYLALQKSYQPQKSKLPGSPIDAMFNETIKFPKTNNTLYFKFIASLNNVLTDEGYSFSQVSFQYERCHPLCMNCTANTLNSCVSCITNASKVGGNCQCNEGYYFSLVRYPEQNVQPGSCLQCNSSCKTCNGPTYQDCNLCQEGYTKVNNTCKYNCNDGKYWNQASLSCLDCHPCCRTCENQQNTACHDCKLEYTFRVQDKSCMIYNAQCQSCTIAVNYLCGGTLIDHNNCLLNGWVQKDANTCVNCSKYVNGFCGGDQTQQVIDACIIQGYFNYNSTNCSSCQQNISGKCGRSEIKDRCLASTWEIYDTNTCIKCTTYFNSKCSIDQTQKFIQACIDKGYYNQDSQSCSSCAKNISNKCGRTEIQDRCKTNGWFERDVNLCVNCNKYVNGYCAGDQTQDIIDYCKHRGFYQYNSSNCSSCEAFQSNFCGISEIKDKCQQSGWIVRDNSVCVNCTKYENGSCGGSYTQDIINYCQSRAYNHYDNQNCSSCQVANSIYCGRNEIKEVCQQQGWIAIDDHNCVDCSKFQNGNCGGDQSQQVINACIFNGYFNYDNNNCSSCRYAISGNCGRNEIKDLCQANLWEIYDANICVNCSKYFNGKCGVEQTEELLNACVQKGFYNYDNQNCSSCRQPAQNDCGRSEIKDRCYQFGWDKYDSGTCKNCNSNSLTKNECICDNTCQTCSRYFNPLTCLSCKQSLYLYHTQCLTNCPNGYKISDQNCIPCTDKEMPRCFSCFKTCLICNPFEISLNSGSCTVCSSTRHLVNGQCVCNDSEDSRQIFFECSYQTVAVLEPILSNTEAILTINFEKQLNSPNDFEQNQFSQALCEYLFTEQTLQLLTHKSECSVQDKLIIVNLDDSSTIFNGDLIYFNKNILSFVSSPDTLIQTYYNNIVVQDQIIGDSKVVFDYPAEENSCADIKIIYTNVLNGAKRGIMNFQWSLKSFIPSSSAQQPALEGILQKANKDKKLSITIPKGVIKSNIIVNIEIDYTLKANVIGKENLVLTVKLEKKIILDIKSPIVFPFYKYQSGLLVIYTTVKLCQPTGDEVTVEPLDFQVWSDEFHMINYYEPNYLAKEYTIKLNPYTLNIGKMMINVVAKFVSNIFIESKANFQFEVQQSQLSVKIIGVNGYVNYKNKLIISSSLRDYDIPIEATDQGIELSWQCIQQQNTKKCVNKNDEEVKLEKKQSVNIDGYTFDPYTVIKLVLTGNKLPDRQAVDLVVILFSELDLPQVGVKMQTNDPNVETVNLNEEIFVKLDYPSLVNVDILSFSGTIQYDNQVVGIIKFDYTSLRFQIWNYFSGFKKELKFFEIRFNVFNPQFYMPSITTLNLVLNFPPENCSFTVNPKTGGYSLETKYFMTLESCHDENKPIQYQFFFYKNPDEFELEKKNPLQVKRRQLNDKSKEFMLETTLPPGQILILAQAIDSKNAIFNTTILVKVEFQKYDEQKYLSIIQSKIDQVNTTSTSDAISDLSILCDDILQRTEFNSSLLLNQKKIELTSILNTLSQQQTSLSSFSTVADKAILSLAQSGIVYKQSEQTEVLSQLIETLDQSTNLEQLNFEVSKEKLKQKLFDSFQVIDAFGNPSQNTEYVDKLSVATDKIGQYLFKNILPNEDPINFKGEFINILGTQITEKYVCSYFYCEEQIKVSDKQSEIFNFKKSEYKDNPYFHDESFLNYTNQLKKQDPQTNITNFPVITPSISSYSSEPIKSFTKQIQINFPIKSHVNQTLKKMTCLSKDESNLWIKSDCQQVYNSKSHSYQCICDKLSPTTVIDDLEDSLVDNNLSTAFSSDGISNILHFKEFYKYAVFWIVVSLTIFFVLFYFFGNLLDTLDKKFKIRFQNKKNETQQPSPPPLHQSSFKSNKVVPMPIQQSIFTNYKKQTEIKEQTEVNLNQSPNLVFSDNLEENMKESKELIFDLNTGTTPKLLQVQSTSPSYLTTQRSENKVPFFTNRTSRRQIKKSRLKFENNNFYIDEDYNQEIENSIQVQKDENHDIISIDQNAQQQTNPPPVQNKLVSHLRQFKKLSLTKQIIIFHNFFGIFILFNQSVPRSLRFLIFYIRSIHSLCVSVLFDYNYSLIQKLVIAIFNALSVIFIVKILTKLMSYKSKAGIYASRIISSLILLGYFYMIFSVVSGQTPEESNMFVMSFGILYIGDVLIFSFFSAIIQRVIAGILLRNANSNVQGVQKYLFKLLELQLVMLQVDMD